MEMLAGTERGLDGRKYEELITVVATALVDCVAFIMSTADGQLHYLF